jgi:outer membrane protein assembly factor BamD
MSRWFFCLILVIVLLAAAPERCPAPLIYRAGEGWSYESVGGVKWERARAKDQLEVAQQAYDKKSYRLALKAARRVVKRWPFSDYAPQAEYLMGRCYAARHMDEKAFKEYQKLITKYPKVDNFQEVLHQQNEIATRFLGGQWFKLWGYIPFFPSMDKTVKMYQQIVKSGPYSDIAPQAQMNIGKAHEKQRQYAKAAKDYELAADRYHDRKAVATEAVYKAGMAYNKQAKRAEYDQSIAGKAIATFTDFDTLFPDDPRVQQTRQIVASLKTEQSRGSYEIARYYEKHHRYDGALIYYNDTVAKDINSVYAAEAKKRIEVIKKIKAEREARAAAAKK